MSNAYDYEKVEDSFRVTHVATDSRVATCFSEENALFVTKALNAYQEDYMDFLRNLMSRQRIVGCQQ